jgi:hypothetical protein
MHLPNLVYVALALWQPPGLCWWRGDRVEQFGYGLGFTAYMVYMLMVAGEGEHKTAHYALCTGFMALGMMLPGHGRGLAAGRCCRWRLGYAGLRSSGWRGATKLLMEPIHCRRLSVFFTAGWVQFDDASNLLSLYVEWQGLTGPGVQAHIHCCVGTPPGNAGIAIDLWLGGNPQPATGTYDVNYDLDLVNPFRPAFVTANGGTVSSAMQALIGAMDAGGGRAYYNIHTAQFPGGEIRGNLAVPEPATLPLLIGGLGLLWAGRRFTRT